MPPFRSAIPALLMLLAGSTRAWADPPAVAEATTSPGTTLAFVDGEPITQAELSQAGGPPLAQLREQVYRLERQRLDRLIEERLLAHEALRRGISVEALLEEEVRSRAGASEEEARAQLAARGGATGPGPTPAELERARARLRVERERELRRALLDELRGRARIDDRLRPPEPYRVLLAGGDRVRGPSDAPVTIVEFSDFHCPFCRRVQDTLARLREHYGGRLRLVYRDFPLDELHPGARRAAEAARCAGEQGRFWEFHDRLYASTEDDASDVALERLAAALRLDAGALVGCVASGRQQAAVAADERAGRAADVTRTPSFFVNGRPLAGSQPYEAFARLIDDELARLGPPPGASGR